MSPDVLKFLNADFFLFWQKELNAFFYLIPFFYPESSDKNLACFFIFLYIIMTVNININLVFMALP